MALSGVEIFKHLPKKTNCKECGFPTCLAFAMKLAAKQVSLDACKYVSEEAKAILESASAPPIRSITFGSGSQAVKLGEETVLFRHEKKFVNPSAFALSIKDTLSDSEILTRLEQVKNSAVDRVGQHLRVEMIAVVNESKDAARYGKVVGDIVKAAPAGTPLILSCTDLSAIEAALVHCASNRPVVYGVTENNLEAMAKLAKEKKVILGVKADGLNALTDLVEKLKGMGVEDMVIDPSPKKARNMIEDFTMIRRAAIKKNFRPLGLPVITFINRDDQFVDASLAAIAVAKYASIIVLDNIEKWKMLSLITLRQNIYTDPQVPMQVEQKIYKIGAATEQSPLLITTNFSLTYFIVQGEVENSKVPAWLAIMDVEGLSVLTAWAAGKFTAPKIATFLKESGIETNIKHREVILPGYVAILSGALEDKLGDGWKVVVGPREANALPAFLKNKVQG